jgi:multicomponent Na+:H+ antiporter subunit F
MSPDIRLVALTSAFLFIGIGMAFCIIRIVRGPSAFDRVLALDCLVLNAVGAMLLVSILLGTEVFIDVVLVVVLLGFLGTLYLATYLERADVE